MRSRIGRYELLTRLAVGGMSEIYLARLEGIGGFEKLYVVKRILPTLVGHAKFRQMLIAEARIASQLLHNSICQVVELGETNGEMYLVMEYLEGIPLLALLRRSYREATLLDLGLIAGIVEQVGEALGYAHSFCDREGNIGVIHRDVSPGNIYLCESGLVKVLDFGIAKARTSEPTHDGVVKGKHGYMAPEQALGEPLDHRVDIFALAVVTFEMLALRALFRRKTDYLTARALIEEPRPDLRDYRPDVPDAIVRALDIALDPEPGWRYASAPAFAAAFTSAVRPWTQREIGDYISRRFADKLARRRIHIANLLAPTPTAFEHIPDTFRFTRMHQTPPVG